LPSVEAVEVGLVQIGREDRVQAGGGDVPGNGGLMIANGRFLPGRFRAADRERGLRREPVVSLSFSGPPYRFRV